jgi:hypothetical protein
MVVVDVSRTYHGTNVQKVIICPFIFRHSLDTTLFDIELSS